MMHYFRFVDIILVGRYVIKNINKVNSSTGSFKSAPKPKPKEEVDTGGSKKELG